jgi:hypothetical protein
MRVGYHVDWIGGFPFEAIRLPDNNGAPLPSMWAYGFDSDAAFLRAAGPALRNAVARSQAILTERAAAAGLRPGAYRLGLRRTYREMLAKARSGAPLVERAE